MKVLAFGCVHFPFERKEECDRLVQIATSEKPDVIVCLGDLLDTTGIGKHVPSAEHLHPMTAETTKAAAFLERLRKAATRNKKKSPRCVWMWGNHEDRIHKAMELNPFTRSAMLQLLTGGEYEKWEVVQYRKDEKGILEIGKVIFFHGIRCGKTGPETEAFEIAEILGGSYGGRLVVSAHTHRPHPPREVEVRGVPISLHIANVGTMADVEALGYTARMNTKHWKAAPLIIDIDDDGNWATTVRSKA